ncbi:MAG TPA: hypothetical protein VFT65_07230 [Candidatus Angelobacter sp.]|nr:hypothetical protein [Candidatus Angelobacter sp.]
MWIWVLLMLGAYHGLNPAMGWLFAVALGLQEKAASAVVRSLLPLGVGHLLSVGLVVGAAQLMQLTLPLRAVRIIAAAVLIGFGLYRLIRRRHPRWVGMRVGSRDLAFWSFLMASAHGAGLMLLPFVMAFPQPAMAAGHAHHMMLATMDAGAGVAPQWWLPVALHTFSYLLVTAALALIVYYKAGVAILRRAWFNLELLWVGSLVAMGVLTLAL